MFNFENVSTRSKKICGHPRSRAGRASVSKTFCVYPRHMRTLQRLYADYNMGRSDAVQMLLDIEEKQQVIRKELLARLRKDRAAQTKRRRRENKNGTSMEH